MKKLNKLSLLLLVASAALNVGFLTGCQTLHDVVYGNPCKYATPGHKESANTSGKEELIRIARLLDVNTSGMTVPDLSAKIRDKLDRNADVPQPFGDSAFNDVTKDLLSGEKEMLGRYQEFISGLQGKRVIVIERED